MKVTIINAALLAAAITLCGVGQAIAQANGPDPQNLSSSDDEEMSGVQSAMPCGEMMPGWMMGRGRMQSGMMRSGMMGGRPMMGMRGPMMKIMFAFADTDGDGALSFEEVTAIHKRIFGSVDANKDGKVTTEEIQAFWRP